MLISLSSLSILLQYGRFQILQPILVAIVVTIATVKVKPIVVFYTLTFVLINLSEETSEIQLLYFGLIGWPK